jgi:hypothetical protein
MFSVTENKFFPLLISTQSVAFSCTDFCTTLYSVKQRNYKPLAMQAHASTRTRYFYSLHVIISHLIVQGRTELSLRMRYRFAVFPSLPRAYLQRSAKLGVILRPLNIEFSRQRNREANSCVIGLPDFRRGCALAENLVVYRACFMWRLQTFRMTNVVDIRVRTVTVLSIKLVENSRVKVHNLNGMTIFSGTSLQMITACRRQAGITSRQGEWR